MKYPNCMYFYFFEVLENECAEDQNKEVKAKIICYCCVDPEKR
jgi:hypothetical protein